MELERKIKIVEDKRLYIRRCLDEGRVPSQEKLEQFDILLRKEGEYDRTT